jgi:DNA polymerase-1
MNNLVIIDGHAIAHRAYHSIPKLLHNGSPVNAIYGFYSMLLSVIDQLEPKYFVVCLDSPGPTVRDSQFIGYRAKRKPTDQDLISQLPLLPQTLDITQIPNIALSGYEADDIIATITKQNHDFCDKISIVTGDKDLMQLVDDKTELFMPIQGLSVTQTITPIKVKEKLGVCPAQVIDLKALMGDMSDNYPGVAGVGPKAANDLLAEYENLDNIYKNIDKIKPSVQAKLIKDKDNAYLSQKLATLIYDVPVTFNLEDSLYNQDKITGLNTLFKQYNFRSLVTRLSNNDQKIEKLSLF